MCKGKRSNVGELKTKEGIIQFYSSNKYWLIREIEADNFLRQL